LTVSRYCDSLSPVSKTNTTTDGWTIEARNVAPFTWAIFGGPTGGELSRMCAKHTFSVTDSAAIVALATGDTSMGVGKVCWAAAQIAKREPVTEESVQRFFAEAA